jgi:hypothetical protein
MRVAKLFYSAASCFRSILSADVSVLVDLVWIPVFFKKKVITASRGGGLALVDVEDLANNINTRY